MILVRSWLLDLIIIIAEPSLNVGKVANQIKFLS